MIICGSMMRKTYQRRLFSYLCCIIAMLACTEVSAEPYGARGMLFPGEMGAKGDGVHDDTYVIQTAIDSLVRIGGGTVMLGSGTFLVSSIKLGPKVSLVGNGNGATIIKQAKGQKQHCVVVRDIAAALKIADLSILGNDLNIGLYVEKSGGYGENHPYLYGKTRGIEQSQAYKWITIDNICIYHFETGLHLEPAGFNINICNSTFSHNGDGVVMSCTDSSLFNCYITNNKRTGIAVEGSNNKISNVKSIFNCMSGGKNHAAIVVNGYRCQLMNCETQDNYGNGFIINGAYNELTNCLSNTDGYGEKGMRYDATKRACGFQINELYNTFSNCVVTNYNEKYGAVYHSPVIVKEEVTYYYPNIYSDIKVLIGKNKLMFHEPFGNVQALSTKNLVEKLNVKEIDGYRYFLGTKRNVNVVKNIDVSLSSLHLLVDFRSMDQGGELLRLDSEKNMRLVVEKSSIVLYWNGNKEAVLQLDDDAVLNKDDLRLILGFSQFERKRFVMMTMFEKTTERGWIKKEVMQATNIPSEWMQNVNVKIGDSSVPVKRLAILQSPLPEAVFMPSSNTNIIYSSAGVYVDVDSCL